MSLGENNFTPGPIPAFLSSFTQLRELSLARCNIVGHIPQWFDILTNLRFLNLQENNIDGVVPDEVWELPELSIVLLTGNNLNGTIPAFTANSEHLGLFAHLIAFLSSGPNLSFLSSHILSLFGRDPRIER